MRSVYDEVYARAMQDPESFWAAAAEAIHWEKRWDRVFDDSRKPFYRWFTGGVLNTCYNALDVHVERGRGKQKALVYDSPVTGTGSSTYAINLALSVQKETGKNVIFINIHSTYRIFRHN